MKAIKILWNRKNFTANDGDMQTHSIMPTSNHRQLAVSAVWTELETRLECRRENFETEHVSFLAVLSSLEMRDSTKLFGLEYTEVGWVRFNVPLDTVQVIWGRYFYRSCDKALKEDGQSSDQASIPPGPPHRVTIIQHACSEIQENTKTHMHLKHSEVNPVRQRQICLTCRSCS